MCWLISSRGSSSFNGYGSETFMPLGTIQKGTYEYKTKIERNETQRRLEMSRRIDLVSLFCLGFRLYIIYMEWVEQQSEHSNNRRTNGTIILSNLFRDYKLFDRAARELAQHFVYNFDWIYLHRSYPDACFVLYEIANKGVTLSLSLYFLRSLFHPLMVVQDYYL